jgi:hypothetical protein
MKKHPTSLSRHSGVIVLCLIVLVGLASMASAQLTLIRENNWLILKSPGMPGGEIRINYLEAYCRANSTDADWVKHTVIPHQCEVVFAAPERVRLRDTLADGVVVEHEITAHHDEVDFRLVATNPTSQRSEAHWAQPCVRLSRFTGFDEASAGNATDYLGKCFIFLDGKPVHLPTPHWATTARYTPGQVWCPAHVPRTDVNPRPLNADVPGNGLIGCESGDGKWIFATAWEPYQELFQGVARCLHSDFRLGGLAPGETKKIRGKIYVVPADIVALERRYAHDFPEQVTTPAAKVSPAQ